jgi:RimJ/RimL family protein N-acetyltransferase
MLWYSASLGARGLPACWLLVGDNIRLRDFVEADAEAFVTLADNDAMFAYMKVRLARESALETHLPWLLREPQLHPRASYNLVLEGSEGFAGWAGVGGMTGGGDAEFGWYLRSDQWGRGYATEATALLLQLGFGELGRRQMYATADPEHAGSVRVLEKSGLENKGSTTAVPTWRGTRPRVLFEISLDQWKSVAP